MIDSILDELFSLRTGKRRENIDDLKLIYALLGKPCNSVKIIHIAGTNGKGSTATFLENILLEAGYNVGKFTSPHILRYNERILYNRQMIDDEEIVENYFFLKQMIENCKRENENLKDIYLNFFEITTFIALMFFAKKNPDFLVIETGLGGRLDATNIINSDIALITNITFDHTAILGNSLKEIAYEKAGIIKNRELCIYADSLPELEEEINKKTENSINIIKKYNDMEIELDKTNYKTLIKFQNNEFILPLFGKFQANNFLLAYETAKFYNIDNETIQNGVHKVYWPARFEFFSVEPPVILDAAHNDDSIRKLIENLTEIYKRNEVIIITSLLETKDFEKVFTKLEKITDKIFITSLKDTVHGLSSAEIRKKMISLNIPVDGIIFEDNILTAYKSAMNIIKGKNSGYKAIVICGSFFEIAKFNRMVADK
ncbi:folylpolyglutamate synthase/dihydrofolate synthase family protein [Leptotrichia sp. oral taxon 212]|uniref:bifunctional folylpolyglutamate synthase/dihydrofolate synthase n=1 Tax=Leptotrichia sp. oral taxon 212 TaxID=712357 RepID=UPI0006A944CB|nr:folylpolyglutamate synthase/dihydrofolate synthase family protein [Leptotrichia sp. oral taxon 212]ALA95091.1 folylpolyglutamate synthase [Leptotrichia sp. oral taxon 212]